MNEKKTAVIVETRIINDITDVIRKHLNKLDKSWELIVFHGDHNRHLFDAFHCEKINIGSIDINGYNHLLTSVTFWETLPYEKVLIFQHDSMLLRKGIDEFLRWDYIGAPIPHGSDQNGGLSLRTKSVMIEVIRKQPYQGPFEDTYFSKYVPSYGHKAPTDIAAKFSCEMMYATGTLGYHSIFRYLTHSQCHFIRNQYNPALYQGLR